MKHLSVTSGIYTLRDLQAHYELKTKGHWFIKDTLSFFNSRLSESLFYGKDKIYFVSSEQFGSNPRRYSVREYNVDTGAINTMGDFQQYKSMQAAKVAAKALAQANEVNQC